MDVSMLCVLLVASSAFAIDQDEGQKTIVPSSSDHYKLEIHGKKLQFKCLDTYWCSSNRNYCGKSGDYVQGSILAPRVIRMTKGECPVIVLQAGNDIIYYHNYFKIILRD